MTSISSLSSATAASPVDAASQTAAAKAKAKAEAAPALNLTDVVSISDEARQKFRDLAG